MITIKWDEKGVLSRMWIKSEGRHAYANEETH
ncbi:hypothetical protein MSWAN_2158 [Methanobacterium paludis]|uniref:Uncharacterized protein n=1 Tax=Methanobacterium paludis (strain DSM 25820 / JCM 18151 / SWAN1) TaxID=868131 RepID=F6D3J0_METPW|nr:hypothetical protein MSWAN_2158 [Methanobacterium paludis]